MKKGQWMVLLMLISLFCLGYYFGGDGKQPFGTISFILSNIVIVTYLWGRKS